MIYQFLNYTQELEEGNSDRHVKYKELKRRDETMTSFLESFPEEMEREKTKLEILKNQIAYAIEQITLQGINLKSYGLSNSDLMNQKNDLHSEAGLLQEYKRLGIQVKQLQVLEKRTTTQLKKMMEDEAELIEQIRNYNNLNGLRSKAAEDMEELTTILEELKKKKRVTEDVVAEAQRKNQELKERLRSNETYRQISHLEEKLLDLMREAKTLQEVVEQNEQENDYSPIKLEVKEIVQNLSKMLAGDNQEIY